jgi:prepilin-type N-terminal cleavage/methylation domain-containing protein
VKHKKLSGFTLIECLVALAILGIGTLTLAQIYTAVAIQSRENEFMNISLAEQMRYVEERSTNNVDSIAIVGNTPATAAELSSHSLDTSAYHVVMDGGPRRSTDDALANGYSGYSYKYGITMYVLYSRDIKNNSSSEDDFAWDGLYDTAGDATGSRSNLRYKYLLPRKAGTLPPTT